MLVDRYPVEEVFARVPELAEQTDAVLLQLDRLLDDDQVEAQVRADLARRSRLTLVHGRHSPPAEALLLLLVVQPRSAWSSQETVERVADALVLRWYCRLSYQRVPDQATVRRGAATIQAATLPALVDRAARLAQQAKVTRARQLRLESPGVQMPLHPPTDSGLVGDGVRVPMPGAVELVRWLSDHDVPLALATSGQRWYAEECLAAIGVDTLFTVRVTGDDVTNSKPDPEIFLAAGARLGVAPSSCLALEDAPLGVAAAVAARMPVIAVPNAFTRGLAFAPDVAMASSLVEVSSWMTLR